MVYLCADDAAVSPIEFKSHGADVHRYTPSEQMTNHTGQVWLIKERTNLRFSPGRLEDATSQPKISAGERFPKRTWKFK